MTMTVITVHGTNDGAPGDAGALWWQTGSDFAQKLQALATGEGARLTIRPFHWDGANSDVSRRKAAGKLRLILRAALKRDGVATVIGHSHGGNVIAFALEDSALAGAHAAGRLKVVSVGTPFLPARRRLIADINSIAVRSVVALASFILLLICAVLEGWLDGALRFHEPSYNLAVVSRSILDDIRYFGDAEIKNFVAMANAQGGAAIASQVEALAPIARIILAGVNGLANYAEIVAGGAALAFVVAIAPVFTSLKAIGDRLTAEAPAPSAAWTVIAHPADEAISLLASALSARIAPTSPQSLARASRRASPLVALLAMIAAFVAIVRYGPGWVESFPERFLSENRALVSARVWQEYFREYLPKDVELNYSWSPDTGYVVDPKDIEAAANGNAEKAAALRDAIEAASRDAADVFVQLSVMARTARYYLRDFMAAIIAAALIIAALSIWLIQLMWLLASPVIGRILSAIANQSITGAMRGAAFGEDGDFVIRGAVTMPPANFRAEQAELSPSVIEQMHADADRNAGETLRKIRRTLLADPARIRGDAYGDLLRSVSWRELIHTSYFEVDEVARHIAVAVRR